MDPTRYYSRAEVESLGNDSLLIVAQNLGLDYQVKQLIWDALVTKGMYEGSPYPSIPFEYKYPFAKIMGMKPDHVLLFLNLMPELWSKVRELVISNLSATGRLREMPVSPRPVSPRLVRPISPRLTRPVRIQYITLTGDSSGNMTMDYFFDKAQEQISVYNRYLGTEEEVANGAEISRDDVQRFVPLNDYSLRFLISPLRRIRLLMAETDGKRYELSKSATPYLFKQLGRLLEGLDQEQKYPKHIHFWETDMKGTSWHVVKFENAIYVWSDKKLMAYKWFSGGYVKEFAEPWQNEFVKPGYVTFIKLSLD